MPQDNRSAQPTDEMDRLEQELHATLDKAKELRKRLTELRAERFSGEMVMIVVGFTPEEIAAILEKACLLEKNFAAGVDLLQEKAPKAAS